MLASPVRQTSLDVKRVVWHIEGPMAAPPGNEAHGNAAPARRRSRAPLMVLGGVVAVVLSVVLVMEARRPTSKGRGRATEPGAPAPAATSVTAPPAILAPSPRPASLPAAPAASAAPAAIELVDLFEGPAPELLDVSHRVVARGTGLASDKLKALYEYAKAHPGDARPHLVMAGDAMNRGWFEMAVGHYERAFKEDPRARGDARMIQDLVAVAGSKHNANAGADAVVRVYGPAALSAVEASIVAAGESGDTARVDRLTALSRRLSPPR